MVADDLFSKYYRELTCKIFVAGHSTEGESVIFLLIGDGNIVYSCVVDSFELNDRIVPKEILYELGLERISDLFWTHPHDDHSKGIIELIEEFSPNNIYIPSELHRLPETYKSISAEVLDQINRRYDKGYDHRFKGQPKVKGIATNTILYNDTFTVGSYHVPFRMSVIAPCSGVVRKMSLSDNYSAMNDFSLVLSLIIGDFSILLTGDVQDRMIVCAQEELCEIVCTPNILKIPHHGSKESTGITGLFFDDRPIDLAVTTAKRSSGLPRDEALQHYTSHCEKVFKMVVN